MSTKQKLNLAFKNIVHLNILDLFLALILKCFVVGGVFVA
jgi:hypothetical protein